MILYRNSLGVRSREEKFIVLVRSPTLIILVHVQIHATGSQLETRKRPVVALRDVSGDEIGQLALRQNIDGFRCVVAPPPPPPPPCGILLEFLEFDLELLRVSNSLAIWPHSRPPSVFFYFLFLFFDFLFFFSIFLILIFVARDFCFASGKNECNQAS